MRIKAAAEVRATVTPVAGELADPESELLVADAASLPAAGVSESVVAGVSSMVVAGSPRW